MAEPLHKRYRPTSFKEVIGQKAAVTAMSRLLERGESQAFLLSGPSGVGKTTLARIGARTVGCEPQGILEIPAADKTGVNDMRDVLEVIQHRPLGGSDAQAVILDECHRLSPHAWDSMLKEVEEPPGRVYWFFCTTALPRVPVTVKTRCTSLVLASADREDLEALVDRVAAMEKISLPDGVRALVIKRADGSPRQALVNLATCRGVKDRAEAAALLQTVVDDTKGPIALCRFLATGNGTWQGAMAAIEGLDENPETTRIHVTQYFSAAVRKTTAPAQAAYFLQVLEAFDSSYPPTDGFAPLLLSIGRIVYRDRS